MSRLLFLTNLGSDYGEYFNLRGFVKLLGKDRVWEWPRKNTYHGLADHYPERYVGNTHYLGPKGAWGELWTDPSLYRSWEPSRFPSVPMSGDGPLHFVEPFETYNPTFEEIIVAIASGEISAIVLGSARWHSSAALSEIMSVLGRDKLPTLIFTDMEDYYQIRTDFIGAFYPDVYFKRTFIKHGNPKTLLTGVDVPVRPLPFSSMWDFDFKPFAERTIDVFCVFGATQVLRKLVRDTVVDTVTSRFPSAKIMAAVGHPLGHKEYLKTLQDSKIVIDHQRMGTDCIRTWEAFAAGSCVIGDLHIEMNDPLIPGVHFYRYENDMSWQGDQQKMDILRNSVAYALANPQSTENVAKAAYQHVREKHTNKARAFYILQEAKNLGYDVGDLV